MCLTCEERQQASMRNSLKIKKKKKKWHYFACAIMHTGVHGNGQESIESIRVCNLSLSLFPSDCQSINQLWISQVRNQRHEFSFSIYQDTLRPPNRAACLPCCILDDVELISFSVFLCSVVHERLPPGFAWHNHLHLSSTRVRTLSVIHATL